jgi:hypothetical protein
MLPMVEDFLTAQNEGIAVRDHSLPESNQQRDFMMKCILLFWIGDYPGQAKVCNQKHAGRCTCHWCLQPFKKGLGTTGSNYAFNMRRELPPNHPMRSNPAFGIDEEDAAENLPAKQRTSAEVQQIGERIDFQDDVDLDNEEKKAIKDVIEATGINGYCIFALLFMFDVVWDFAPDMMHIMKDIWQDHLLPLFKGADGAKPMRPKMTKLTNAAGDPLDKKTIREKKAQFNSRVTLWEAIVLVTMHVRVHAHHHTTSHDTKPRNTQIDIQDMHITLPLHILQIADSWKLTKKEQDIVDQRGCDLQLPGNFVPKVLKLMSLTGTYKCSVITALCKTSLWQHLFAGFYTASQQQALFKLAEVQETMHSATSDIDWEAEGKEWEDDKAKRWQETLDRQLEIDIALCHFEKEFPATKMLGCVHIQRHVPKAIFKWNNVRNYHAFPMERYMRVHIWSTMTTSHANCSIIVQLCPQS